MKLFLAFLLMVMPAAAFAQTQPAPFCQNGTCTYIPLEPLPLGTTYSNCYGGVTPACPNPVPFQALVVNGFKLLLGAAAAIAVVMLVLGALTYMFSDVLQNKTKALSRIRGAMWGIVLLVSSYLILNTINPDLVTFKLDLTPLTTTQPGTTGNPAVLINTNPTSGTPTPNPQTVQAAQNQCSTQCASQSKTGYSYFNADNTPGCTCI